MAARLTSPLTSPDGAAEQFVRGFASCPHGAHEAGPAPALDGLAPAPEPLPEFRLTTVVPGVAVSIELGGFGKPW
ncbi:hypothetical protein ACPWT1_01335 [Ramlibacter sp. MMS24-I3-19]|uniref:hypothetical protein n=1 Tax=Ramlibacter sp. MMS24-I3-19 TaxID=3416606 RepID=UPI003D01C82B